MRRRLRSLRSRQGRRNRPSEGAQSLSERLGARIAPRHGRRAAGSAVAGKRALVGRAARAALSWNARYVAGAGVGAMDRLTAGSCPLARDRARAAFSAVDIAAAG